MLLNMLNRKQINSGTCKGAMEITPSSNFRSNKKLSISLTPKANYAKENTPIQIILNEN